MEFDKQTTVPENGEKSLKGLWFIPLVVIFSVILADQLLKFHVKEGMPIHTEKVIFPNWFILHFTENNGMAFGLEIEGYWGKLILSLFRMAVALFGFYYLYKIIRSRGNRGFILCISLILAGAIGNIIDSMFYGIWFKSINDYQGGFLFGRVVDMLYFPLIETHYPAWFPFGKAGETFIFFSPVFNLADSAISIGIISILVFQKRFFKRSNPMNETNDLQETEKNQLTESGQVSDTGNNAEEVSPLSSAD